MKSNTMLIKHRRRAFTLISLLFSFISAASGQSSNDPGISAKIQQLVDKVEMLTEVVSAQQSEIDSLKKDNDRLKTATSSSVPSTKALPLATKSAGSSAFNPAISAILNGRYGSFSRDSSEISGFSVGEEGERGSEGLAIDESELNFSASVDDKFTGSLTAALVREDGEDKVELEEAFVETQPAAGLPNGFSLKAGRAFWTLGYLNEHHSHADDFADRPLPYRAFLNSGFNDDGVQVSYLLPTDFYSEIGGGMFRGDDFPFGSANGSGVGAWSGFLRVGGDIGEDQSWRLGGYVLSGDTDGRFTQEDEVSFIGDTDLYATDLRYTWAPTGNSHEQE
ncbi:MAG: hypothetical protein KDD53_07795, partial [Bdellovibrionales bacterium]|nr:hypothetical protein [Bdellovibrionales bacterium]